MGALPDDETLEGLLDTLSQTEVARMYKVTRQAVSWRAGRLGLGVEEPQTCPTRDIVFDAIVAYKQAHDGCSPGVRELSEMVGRSYSNVWYHVQALADEGLIELLPGNKGICVVGGSWKFQVTS